MQGQPITGLATLAVHYRMECDAQLYHLVRKFKGLLVKAGLWG
jgi:hypothetical protein